MTKNEAIKFIEKASDTPCGFIVMAISREDIEQRYSDESIKTFDMFSPEVQEMVLGEIARLATDMMEDFDYSETLHTICGEAREVIMCHKKALSMKVDEKISGVNI